MVTYSSYERRCQRSPQLTSVIDTVSTHLIPIQSRRYPTEMLMIFLGNSTESSAAHCVGTAFKQRDIGTPSSVVSIC